MKKQKSHVKNTTKTGVDSGKNVVKITTVTERAKWEKFMLSRPESNFLQSWDFYEFHAARGKTVVRRAAVDARGRILGAYAGVVETAKRGRYLAIAGGPIADLENRELVEKLFDDIREVGRANHCVFVRVRPQWPLSSESLGMLLEMGLEAAPMFLSVERAGILDLRKSEEEILAGASQGFRRKLRKAEKAGVAITADTKRQSIDDFCTLEQLHATRQQYVPFSREFLTKQFEAFAKNDEIKIYTAKKDGEILAQNFIVFYGQEASYHYGVSSEAGTRISAAPLLHLAAMREARERGCTRYNLWGIVGQEETWHRFYGVSEFKRSFGCEEFWYTPAHDLILKRGRYLITKMIETARKKIRHL